jgi:hypothetical protein
MGSTSEWPFRADVTSLGGAELGADCGDILSAWGQKDVKVVEEEE